jgi:MFS family permease
MTATAASMRTFFIVWFGQLVSVTGTILTAFGLQLYVFSETGSVTNLSFVALAYTVPAVVLAPYAGAIADRLDRRLVMLGADAVAGAATLVIAGLFFADALQLWHIYLLVAAGSSANSFQEPAWSASITLLVPREQLPRANALVQLNQGLSIVIAPAVAGALLVTVGLGGVLLVDVITFLVGVGTLAAVRFPRVERVGRIEGESWATEAMFAWRYLRRRPGLLGLLWLYAGINFMLSFGNVLIIPLIVSFASEAAAGGVLSAAGVGGVAGSLVVSVWGGPKRLVAGIMSGLFAAGLVTAIAGLRASVLLIGVAFVLLLAIVPVVSTLSQTIWQRKVEPGVQGRIFSLRRMISSAVSPLAIVAAGPLADGVFEPRLQQGGALADSVGRVIGTGPGRGIGFLLILSGLGMMALAAYGWGRPRIRNIETEIPDADIPEADFAGGGG